MTAASRACASRCSGTARPRRTWPHALACLGADAVDVPVYRWQWPEDRDPALRLIQAVVEAGSTP